MDFLVVFFAGLLVGGLFCLSWFRGTDAPYVPTKNIRIKKLLKVINLKKGQVFYELGSGDGRVVIEAAKMGVTSIGIEQSLIRVWYSRWKARSLPNAKFIHNNIFDVIPLKKGIQQTSSSSLSTEVSDLKVDDLRGNDMRTTNIVFIFLLPKGIAKLESLLKKNLEKGSIVITQTFHFNSWKPYKKVLIKNKSSTNTPLGKDVVEGDFWLYRKT
jgi:hypothetical protein